MTYSARLCISLLLIQISSLCLSAESNDNDGVSYRGQVQPILNQRCVVCHSCFDAPCQLNLASYEGLSRGASKEVVHAPKRLSAIDSTRMFTDAQTTAQWRGKGFFPVLHREGTGINLQKSIFYQILQQKLQVKTKPKRLLGEEYGFGAKRRAMCPDTSEYPEYRRNHPLRGMPYGFPALSEEEFATMTAWLNQGAYTDSLPKPDPLLENKIDFWEAFLNRDDLKYRLVSRYLYEHLFHTHLYFFSKPHPRYFELVRSGTPPGQAIELINTVRPYDDPGIERVYYRFRPVRSAIVAKSHNSYLLDGRKFERLNELFIDPYYSVNRLPGYQTAAAANPFITFQDLPAISRYRFMLDDAVVFIRGFIRGPVCRGQIALNVMHDRFWVLFTDPWRDPVSRDSDFLAEVSGFLRLPIELKGHLNVAAAWNRYGRSHRAYQKRKHDYLARHHRSEQPPGLEMIWHGAESRSQPVLTVFRHFDSASVMEGMTGRVPHTAWILDYPLFERIHYLLAAGFNVFGNVSHHANTRLYMDYIRMEAENRFLGFLPPDVRTEERDRWYRSLPSQIKHYLHNRKSDPNWPVAIGYRSGKPREEFFQLIASRLRSVHGRPAFDYLNRCMDPDCLQQYAPPHDRKIEKSLLRLLTPENGFISHLPDLALIRIERHDNPDLVYTLVRNVYHSNVSFMFAEDLRLDPSRDTLTLVKGYLGSYPNYFFSLEEGMVGTFVRRLLAVDSPKRYARLTRRFGVRRSDRDFWRFADWFQDDYWRSAPIDGGILDLSRYENR